MGLALTFLIPYLALLFAPDTAELVAQLGSPKFVDREKAQRKLQGRMCYGLALQLDRIQPKSPEIARRVDILIRSYWDSAYPPPEKCPYLDALSEPNCSGLQKTPKLFNYWLKACDTGVTTGGPKWLDYRMATWLMLQDLRSLRVPPILVKPLLWYMQYRSDQWDRFRGYPPKPQGAQQK